MQHFERIRRPSNLPAPLPDPTLGHRTHPQLLQSMIDEAQQPAVRTSNPRRTVAQVSAEIPPVSKAVLIAEMIASEYTDNRGNLLIEVSEHLRKMGQGFTGACLWHAGQRYNAG
jgi:hypothetical protein